MLTSKGFYGLLIAVVLSLTLMSACGGGGGGGSSTSDNNTGGSTYSISGKVADSSSIGISGVTVGLTGANTSSATTDSSGNFNFTGLANGSYTVMPTRAGYTFNPVSIGVTISGSSVTEQDFVFTANPTDTTTTDITITVPSIDISGGKNNLQMYTSVVIQDGTPLTNLTSGNFTIEETINGITKTAPITSITTSSASGSSISTALVLDSSGSLSSTEVEDIKTAAKSFVNNMKSNDYAAVIDFDTDVTTRQSFTNDKNLLISAIDSISSGGGTSLYDAIYDAVTLSDFQSGQRTVIVMTDGQNNHSSHTETDAINYAASKGIPVYTIGMGNGVNITVLKEISDGTYAGSNGSGYYSAPTSTELTALYNTISNVLSNIYIIGWSSTGSSGDTISVKINVNYTAANGTFTDSFMSSYVVPGTGTTYTISGTITDSSNVAVPGVTVALAGTSTISTTTDSNGNYSFADLANGSYTATPSKLGYTFNPANMSVTVSGANVTAQNFVGSGALPITLTSGLIYPQDIAVDSTSVYWTDSASLKKVPISGGTVTTLATEPSIHLAIDSTSVYWTDASGVKKTPINGGTITTLASGGLGNLNGIAVDSANIYFASWAYCANCGVMNKVNINGGTVTTLASGQNGLSSNIVVDSTYTYFVDSGGVKKVPKGGGNVTTIASVSSSCYRIAVDSTSVYWTEQGTSANNYNDGAVKKVSINGGTITTLASGVTTPKGVASDSTSIYWTEGEWSGTLKKMNKNDGTVTTIASELNLPSAIAVDSTSVYWTEYDAVKKIAK